MKKFSIVVAALALCAGLAQAAAVQLDISSGYTFDGILGPGEYAHGATTGSRIVGGVYAQHNYVVSQQYSLVILGESYGSATPDDSVAADGVYTAASGTVYQMAGLADAEVTDPSTGQTNPNIMATMVSHNKNTGYNIASAAATLPVGQQQSYTDINFLIASTAQTNNAAQMDIWATYTDGTSELLWAGSNSAPRMTANDGGSDWAVAGQFDWMFNSSSGAIGAAEDHRGTYSFYEFKAPLALDSTKTLEGVSIIDNNPSKNWYARGLMIFAATATPVPEPTTLGLLALGALALRRRRR